MTKVAQFGIGSIGKECRRSLMKNNFDVVTFGSSDISTHHLDYSNPLIPQVINHTSGDSYDSLLITGGVNANDSILDYSEEKLSDVLSANIINTTSIIHAMLSNRSLQDGSKIVLIGSIWSNMCKPSKMSYIISKSAIKGIVKSLSVDLRPRNIMVNAILPGVVETPMSRHYLDHQKITYVQNNSIFNRLVSCEDIANLALFLLGPTNSFVTGQCITCDGGFTNSIPL